MFRIQELSQEANGNRSQPSDSVRAFCNYLYRHDLRLPISLYSSLALSRLHDILSGHISKCSDAPNHLVLFLSSDQES
eukprot:763632-Hanusia_phi.AAC.1